MKKQNKIKQGLFGLILLKFSYTALLISFIHGLAMPFVYGASAKQVPKVYRISLDQAGITMPIRLVGNQASTSLDIPVNPTLKAQSLTLQVVPSPNLPFGKLWASSNGVVIATLKLLENSSIWTIPLNNLVSKNRFIPLTLHMVLQSTNICEAMAGNWLQFGPSGTIQYTESGSPETLPISDFFPPILNKIQILFPNTALSAPQAQAVLNLGAYLGRQYRLAAPPRMEFLTGPLPKQTDPWERLIWMGGEKTSVSNLPAGGYVLSLGPSPDQTTQALFEVPFGIEAAVATQITNWQSKIIEPYEVGAKRVTLASLGYGTEQVTGLGQMKINYEFAQADLGGMVQNLALRLKGHYTPLPQNASGNIQIRFNDVLVFSQELKNDTYHIRTKIDNDLLTRNNKLQIVFSYSPTGDSCSEGALPLTANVDSHSFIEYDFGNILPKGFDLFPTRFANDFFVTFDYLDQENLMQAAHIIENLQTTTRRSLYPRFTTEFRVPYLYIGAKSPPDAMISTHPVKIKNDSGIVLLQFLPDEPFAVLESNSQRLILAGPSHLRNALLEKTILTKNGWYNLIGDAVLMGTTQIPSNIDVHGNKLIVQKLSQSQRSFFDQYRIWFFAGTGVILFFIFVWLYPRIIRKPPEGE